MKISTKILMENDKGKKPIYEEEEEEEDFLQLLMGHNNYNQPNILSPCEPLSPINPTQNNILANGETIMLQGSSSSSSGSGDIPAALEEQEIMEGVDDEDDFFFKFLTMRYDNNVPHHLALGGSSMPPLIENVQPPAPEAITKLSLPRAKGKAMSPEKLAELAMQDPKKAKRIITNRMSAVRAKEKKKLYIYMLEHRIQTLNSESAALKAHLTLLQTESKGLNNEHVRLKEQTNMVVHEIHLQDSLNEEVRKEIMHLRVLAQMVPRNENSRNNLPNPYVDQLRNGVQQMNLGQQYYPWQVQADHQQIQQANQFQHLMQQYQDISPFSSQGPIVVQDPNNIANPPPYSSDDQESNDE